MKADNRNAPSRGIRSGHPYERCRGGRPDRKRIQTQRLVADPHPVGIETHVL